MHHLLKRGTGMRWGLNCLVNFVSRRMFRRESLPFCRSGSHRSGDSDEMLTSTSYFTLLNLYSKGFSTESMFSAPLPYSHDCSSDQCFHIDGECVLRRVRDRLCHLDPAAA